LPELAEVETLRRDIWAELADRTVEAVAVTGSRSVRRQDPGELRRRVSGRTLVGARRRGKFLILDLDGGDALVAHMGMSGQLRLTGTGDAGIAHTHLVLSFDDGRDLRFVDPRTFGQMWVTRPVGGQVPELAHLGFEPLDDPDAPRRVAALLSRPTRLKPLLMDQTRVAGIGNMYADEILWASRLRPDRPASSVPAAAAGRLHRAMVSVLSAAIAGRGSSLADAQYRDIYGRTGSFQEEHRVYAREGEPCRRCRAPVVRLRFSGRSSFFCARCQS
jgi:formamidopyrimidine-DNA glycosylase